MDLVEIKTKRRLYSSEVQKLALFGILVVITGVFASLTPKFLVYLNLINVLMQVAQIILLGGAITLLMVSGNFDLSIGSVVAFTGVMHAYMCKHGIPTNLSILCSMVLGALCGLLNGTMVVKLGINSVIATLGIMYAARGAAFLIARADGGANIEFGLPPNYEALGRTMVGPVPLFVIIIVMVVAVFLFIQIKSNFSKYIFATGGNKAAAVLSGVKVDSIIFSLYLIVGALAGFGGALLSSRIGSGVPRVGRGLEFDVIIAVVLGGTSIYGGEGSILGMIVGAFIVGFVWNGLNLLNVHDFYQTVIKGAILICSVLIYRKIKEKIG
jgi:ribose transport system permease protein